MTNIQKFDLFPMETYEDLRAMELVEEGQDLIDENRDVEGRSKLRHAIDMLGRIKERKGEAVFLCETLCHAHFLVTRSFLKTHRLGEAVGHLKTALSIIEAADSIATNDPDRLRVLSDILGQLCATLRRSGMDEDALAMQRRILGIFRQRARSQPDKPGHQLEYVVGLFNYGEMLLDLGESAQSVKPLREVMTFFEDYARQYPRNLSMERSIADAAIRLGDALNNLGHADEAMALYARTVVIHEKLVTQEADNVNRQNALLASRTRLAGLQRSKGLLDTALDGFRRCVALVEIQVAIRSDDREWRFHLHKTLDNLGHCLVQAQASGEAIVAFQRSLRIKKDLLNDADGMEWAELQTGIVKSMNILALLSAAS